MSRKNKRGYFEKLVNNPWWLSVSLSIVFLAVAYVAIPKLQGSGFVIYLMAAKLLDLIKYPIAFFIALPAPFAYLKMRRKRKLFEVQDSIETIRQLNWRQFEEMTAEIFRRKGFTVVENETLGADGGIDIVVKKEGQTHLVQCKQWRSQKVGVPVVREMYGVLVDKSAASIYIITSGFFTEDAIAFAVGKPIVLIDGEKLQEISLDILGKVRPAEDVKTASLSETNQINVTSKRQRCKRCGADMVVRKSKQGNRVGQPFMGCSTFPKCREVQPYRQ